MLALPWLVQPAWARALGAGRAGALLLPRPRRVHLAVPLGVVSVIAPAVRLDLVTARAVLRELGRSLLRPLGLNLFQHLPRPHFIHLARLVAFLRLTCTEPDVLLP